MWQDADTNRVGSGKYTENAPNRKFCGWSNEGITRFNELNDAVTKNREKQYKETVEKEIYQTLAERYKKMLGVKRKNSRKRRHHMVPREDGDGEENEEEDGRMVTPKDELVLWNTHSMSV